jgi:hypothetical protein
LNIFQKSVDKIQVLFKTDKTTAQQYCTMPAVLHIASSTAQCQQHCTVPALLHNASSTAECQQ